MKLAEAMKFAAKGNLKYVRGVSEFCRFTLGWNYEKTARMMKKETGIDPADWEELLQDAE